MKYGPMLAKPGTEADLTANGYVYEPKLDGIRCLVECNNRVVTLYSRTLRDMTYQFPEVVSSLQEFASSLVGYTVLDGEIVAKNFQELQSRTIRVENVDEYARTTPAKFVAFDVLVRDGHELIAQPLHKRRTALVAIIGIEVTPQSSRGQHLFDETVAAGGEGVMAKLRYAHYFPDMRMSCWLKIKPTKTAEVYIGGTTFGTGRRESVIGAVLVGELLDNGRLRYMGSVGTGFSDVSLNDIDTLVNDAEVDDSPFFDYPLTNSQAGNVKTWCKPTLKATVGYQEKTRIGILRFPVWRGLVH